MSMTKYFGLATKQDKNRLQRIVRTVMNQTGNTETEYKAFWNIDQV